MINEVLIGSRPSWGQLWMINEVLSGSRTFQNQFFHTSKRGGKGGL
jgi:hypothetical protein